MASGGTKLGTAQAAGVLLVHLTQVVVQLQSLEVLHAVLPEHSN